MEHLTLIEKLKMKELKYISDEISENILYFSQMYDKLRYSVFTIILPVEQINKYKNKKDYLIIVDNNSTFTDFFKNLGFYRAVKREIKRFYDIPLINLKFDMDNEKFEIKNRLGFRKVMNIKNKNQEMVIFTFRKNRDYDFQQQKNFKELI